MNIGVETHNVSRRSRNRKIKRANVELISDQGSNEALLEMLVLLLMLVNDTVSTNLIGPEVPAEQHIDESP